jgi:ABC-type Mn2+/Zn2+ transport system permease subunit
VAKLGDRVDILLDPFLSNAFMQRALLAGVVVSLACAVVGTFVVLRGLAFIGDALAHGVLPGIAGALLLGLPGMLGAAVGAVVMIGGVSLVTRRSRLSSDTAIGLLFVAMLALGVVMISASDAFSGDLIAILFGQILGTSTEQLLVMAVAAVVVMVVAALAARPFLLLSFDAEQADVAGFPARRYHVLMLLLVALTVIVAFQTVGTLLVFGMLLAPAAAGALLAVRIGSMMLIAAVIGSAATYVGLLISYWLDLAAGATIVLTAVSAFFVVLAFTMVRDASRHVPTVDSAGETVS